MPAPNAVKRFANCAQGKGVRVVTPEGAFRVLANEDEDPVTPQADQTAEKLLELDAQIRATVGMVAAIATHVSEMARRVEDTLTVIKTMAETVAAGQIAMQKSADQIAEVLAQPVKPVYNGKGKLIAAQRVKQSTTGD